MNGIGRAVWWVQWAALVATPIWWVVASTFTGGGWLTLLAMLIAVPTFLLMLVGPIVGVAARRYRIPHQMPGVYGVIALVQWILGAFWPLTLISAGDIDSGPSALGSLGVPERVAGALGTASIVGFFATLIGGIVVLVVLLAIGRSSGDSGVTPPTAAQRRAA